MLPGLLLESSRIWGWREAWGGWQEQQRGVWSRVGVQGKSGTRNLLRCRVMGGMSLAGGQARWRVLAAPTFQGWCGRGAARLAFAWSLCISTGEGLHPAPYHCGASIQSHLLGVNGSSPGWQNPLFCCGGMDWAGCSHGSLVSVMALAGAQGGFWGASAAPLFRVHTHCPGSYGDPK